MEQYEKAIEDCNEALKINHKWTKAYFRKAVALQELHYLKGAAQEAIFTFREGLMLAESDGDKEMAAEISKALSQAEQELQLDTNLPADHPERLRSDAMLDWMRDGGAEFNKLKLRYYTEDYRGVHAARDIKQGDTLLFVPKDQLLTIEVAMTSPIVSLMVAKNLGSRLPNSKHSFFATFLMEEVRKQDSKFSKYINILPKGEGFSSFPYFYSQEEKSWLKGSPLFNILEERNKIIDDDYLLICKEVPEYKQFPKLEYC